MWLGARHLSIHNAKGQVATHKLRFIESPEKLEPTTAEVGQHQEGEIHQIEFNQKLQKKKKKRRMKADSKINMDRYVPGWDPSNKMPGRDHRPRATKHIKHT